MKVGLAIYGDLYQTSGGYLYDRKLKEHLEMKGDDVEVISLEKKEYMENVEDNFKSGLYEKLNGLDVDILVEDELSHPSLFFLNDKLNKYPIISIVHHLSYLASKGWKREMYRYFEGNYLKSVDGFVYSSPETKDSVEHLVGDSDGIVAVPGCDHVSVDESELESYNSFGHEYLKVLFVGNVAENKGLDNLLEALELVDNVNLKIIGRLDIEPEYSEKLLDRAVNFPNIDVLGYVEEGVLREEMKKCDLLVLPSRYEGFGLVILEAFAFGKPVISTCRGGPCSIVDDRENGFLINPEDSGDIAEKLIYFKNNPEELERMGDNARISYERSECWEDSMEKIRTYLNQVSNL